MTLTHLGVFVPMKVMSRTVLMCVVLLMCLKTGSGSGLSGACRPVCVGSDCITMNQDRVDFRTAEEACREKNGELLSLQSDTDRRIFEIMFLKLLGDFWIGLRLPTGVCSNLSAPLRGYEWTSGRRERDSNLSAVTWREAVRLCSPRCVSLSTDGKWSERPCSIEADGFLCRTTHRYACQAQKLSNSVSAQKFKKCSSGPCEHVCKDVKEGYECSCNLGYILDAKKPGHCVLHCALQSCPAVCPKNAGGSCICPDGFLLNEKLFCEDIDECDMGECDHECKNTFGSFVCTCRKGYVPKGNGKCKKADKDLLVTTPVAVEVVRPSPGNHTQRGSMASSGGLVWIWIVLALAVLACIFLIRFHVVKRQKRREQTPTQELTPSTPVNDIEC